MWRASVRCCGGEPPFVPHEKLPPPHPRLTGLSLLPIRSTVSDGFTCMTKLRQEDEPGGVREAAITNETAPFPPCGGARVAEKRW